jgi:hypothetical protein
MHSICTWWVFYDPGDDDHWGNVEYVRLVKSNHPEQSWTCNEETRQGDCAFLYARRPISAIVAILRATSDADPRNAAEYTTHGFWCRTQCLAVLERPLALSEMKTDRELTKQWGLVRANFQPPGGRPPRVEASTLDLLAERIPELKSQAEAGS